MLFNAVGDLQQNQRPFFRGQPPPAVLDLQRCGHRPRVVRHCPPGTCFSFDQPVLARGRALWVEGKRLRSVWLRGGAISSQELGAGARLVGSAGRRVYLVSGHRLRHVTL